MRKEKLGEKFHHFFCFKSYFILSPQCNCLSLFFFCAMKTDMHTRNVRATKHDVNMDLPFKPSCIFFKLFESTKYLFCPNFVFQTAQKPGDKIKIKLLLFYFVCSLPHIFIVRLNQANLHSNWIRMGSLMVVLRSKLGFYTKTQFFAWLLTNDKHWFLQQHYVEKIWYFVPFLF